MASIAASVWPRPVALVPCLSWTTASCVFTQGVMSGAIPWHLLENQYFSDCVYREELRNLVFNLNDDTAFEAGQHFVSNYAESMERVSAVDKHHTMEQARKEILAEKDSRANKTNTYLFMQNVISSSSISLNNSLSFTSSSGNTSVQQTIQPSSSWSALSATLKLHTKKQSYTEALQFMRGIMDEFTHLARFSRPVDPSLIIIVVAKDDAYVLREGIEDLSEVWAGAEVRYIDAGHIAAFLFKQSVFRKAIIDAFDRLTEKYYKEQQ